MRNKYDVVVIGAGPAGSSAAKTAVEKGAKTIILEEHTAIGLPYFCNSRLAGSTKSGLSKEIIAAMGKHAVVGELKASRIFTPSGKMVREVPLAGSGAYAVRRDLFDRELAKQAANAGAEIVLHCRVTGLLKDDGRVIGVTTNSRTIPNVYGEVVIAADGIGGPLRGVAKWEGLAPDVKPNAGIHWELTRVRDIEVGIHEYHVGAFHRGCFVIRPVDDVSCLVGTSSVAELEQIKRGNSLVSKKLRDAIPVRLTGYSLPDLGTVLPKVVMDGLILTGSGANFMGILIAVASGRYAGEVAAMASQERNVREERLSQCEQFYRKLAPPGHGAPLRKWSGLSEEALEKLLPDLVETGELDFFDTIPI